MWAPWIFPKQKPDFNISFEKQNVVRSPKANPINQRPFTFFSPQCNCEPECTTMQFTQRHTQWGGQVYLRASSPAGSGRKQCGEFIMQMTSVRICSVSSCLTTWLHWWCSLKKAFYVNEWLYGHRTLAPTPWARRSSSSLSEQASFSQPKLQEVKLSQAFIVVWITFLVFISFWLTCRDETSSAVTC